MCLCDESKIDEGVYKLHICRLIEGHTALLDRAGDLMVGVTQSWALFIGSLRQKSGLNRLAYHLFGRSLTYQYTHLVINPTMNIYNI